MIILISCRDFINNVKYLVDDVMRRLSIVQPQVFYKNNFIVVTDYLQNIRIIFTPALQKYVKGMRPDYYWTNSYEVDKYFRECVTPKFLQDFTELADVVLQTCLEEVLKNG